MDENAVVKQTCKLLEEQGLVIKQRLSTIERGVDISRGKSPQWQYDLRRGKRRHKFASW